jgi:hypothetical protein
MMKGRSGGGGRTQSTLSSTTSNSTRQYELNLFSNDRIRTIILTSSIWAVILGISIFTVIRFSSPANCSQNSLIKNALCGIGQVLTRFCSDQHEQIFISPSKSHSIQKKSISENVVKVKYTDIYADETCQRNGQCSNEQGYRVPDQCMEMTFFFF